ncbi:MAG: hypothetical protein M1826_004789 [Phylliscum demangeonii]|nr:MAG: hypothetical protein M1826_004789 [Phylliscum demangeonii]
MCGLCGAASYRQDAYSRAYRSGADASGAFQEQIRLRGRVNVLEKELARRSTVSVRDFNRKVDDNLLLKEELRLLKAEMDKLGLADANRIAEQQELAALRTRLGEQTRAIERKIEAYVGRATLVQRLEAEVQPLRRAHPDLAIDQIRVRKVDGFQGRRTCHREVEGQMASERGAFGQQTAELAMQLRVHEPAFQHTWHASHPVTRGDDADDDGPERRRMNSTFLEEQETRLPADDDADPERRRIIATDDCQPVPGDAASEPPESRTASPLAERSKRKAAASANEDANIFAAWPN